MVFSSNLQQSFDWWGTINIKLVWTTICAAMRLLFTAVVARFLVPDMVKIPETAGGHQTRVMVKWGRGMISMQDSRNSWPVDQAMHNFEGCWGKNSGVGGVFWDLPMWGYGKFKAFTWKLFRSAGRSVFSPAICPFLHPTNGWSGDKTTSSVTELCTGVSWCQVNIWWFLWVNARLHRHKQEAIYVMYTLLVILRKIDSINFSSSKIIGWICNNCCNKHTEFLEELTKDKL